MALGPGKYDELATAVRQDADARAVILLVLDGIHGSGFSCQATADVLAALPMLLRRLADDIERDTGGAVVGAA